jgi:hypothetical protein
MTVPPNDYGIPDAALAQRIAELSDADFAKLVNDTRPHGGPLSPIDQARAVSLARKSAVTAKTQQLTDMRAESDAQHRVDMAAMLPQATPPDSSAGEPTGGPSMDDRTAQLRAAMAAKPANL